MNEEERAMTLLERGQELQDSSGRCVPTFILMAISSAVSTVVSTAVSTAVPTAVLTSVPTVVPMAGRHDGHTDRVEI